MHRGRRSRAERWRAPAARDAAAPRIVIVGAGLAGLSWACRLKQAGYVAQVFEASDRVGGRCRTGRGAFADGQLYEHGGELIDQGVLRRSAVPLAEITDDIKRVWQKIHDDISAASYPTLFDTSTECGRQLDALSILDWIEKSVPGGMQSRLDQLLDVAYTIEYRADSAEQNSLSLLYLLGSQGQGQFRVFGKSNEKYTCAAFAGIEGRQEGNAHFCGEHTSIDFRGYLNGSVETGER